MTIIGFAAIIAIGLEVLQQVVRERVDGAVHDVRAPVPDAERVAVRRGAGDAPDPDACPRRRWCFPPPPRGRGTLRMRLGERMRATTSTGPPAAKGTTIVTARAGQDWAKAAPARTRAAKNAATIRSLFMGVPSLVAGPMGKPIYRTLRFPARQRARRYVARRQRGRGSRGPSHIPGRAPGRARTPPVLRSGGARPGRRPRGC